MSALSRPWIFVQIPAYCDSELAPTVRSLYARADDPGRLRTVIAWQRAPGEEDLPEDLLQRRGLEILESPAAESRGPNWARHEIQHRYSGEELTLMLDSHMRFEQGWDAAATGMLATASARSGDRTLLTGYLPGFIPRAGARGRRTQPTRIYPLHRQDGVLTRLTSYVLPFWRQLDAPVEAEYLSLHFVLAPGEFNEAVPHDPEIYFFGDEVALGCRAYTHGWTLWHPHRVIGWHAYDRSTRVPHWETHRDWHAAHLSTLDRLRGLFAEDPAYRRLLGRERSVADYERHIMTRLVVR
ncbi:GlcNAc-transferase family protein [Microbacterium deminutum]|uniref:Glycosyltransferase (GlcNAc) n=1 Tax=Microbacterium deminutum TaxID=344164 RepID=A0ABN2QXW8_9MICO